MTSKRKKLVENFGFEGLRDASRVFPDPSLPVGSGRGDVMIDRRFMTAEVIPGTPHSAARNSEVTTIL
jgi:hypothetical protein